MKILPFPNAARTKFGVFALAGGAIAAVGLLVGCMTDAGAPTARPDPESFPAAFAQPPRAVQAKFRWWWPHGLVDPAEIRREVADLAAAGFGGAEIADVHHSVSEPLDPAGYGWGTEPWVKAVVAALEEAKVHGMTMDLTLGPSWPAALPTVDPNSPEAMTELATGTTLVEAGETYSGAIPPPEVRAHRDGTRESLLLVQAARLADGADPTAEEVELVAGSVREVPIDPNATELRWTAPAEGRWLLISYWQRGSGQRPERGPHSEPLSYVVDHFSRAGAEAVIEFWETRILDDRMRGLLQKVGGAFFEDSIEMETDVTLWTPGLLDIFEKRKGYSLLPYLPLIVQKDEDPIFRFNGDIAAHVEHDWWGLMGELFIEEHLAPLQEWAHGLGMQLRGQPYGMPTDAVSAAAYLDIVEGESLGFKNLDDYRSLAGGRDMGGHKILSNEAGAFAGGAYSTTWKRMLRTLNPIFAGGVNQTVLHGYSYAEVPGVKWPGFAAFTPYSGYPGYTGSWGPRQPTWAHVPGIADYFARVHLVLQSGVPQVDVAFLRQKGYAGSGFGAPWLSTEGNALGWSHAFISPATLELPTATVRDGRLAPDGPAYRVLVFEGDAFHRRETTMPVETARKLLELAQSGLPMVVVGDWSNPKTSGLPQDNEEAELKSIFDQLLALPDVANVATREEIGQGLDRLGIDRAVEHASAPFVHAARREGDRSYYFFANPGDAHAAAKVWIERPDPRLIPYSLDPWTGEVTPVALYSNSDDTIALDLNLVAGSTAIIALASRDWSELAIGSELHAVSSDAESVRDGEGGLRIRAFRDGPYQTELSDGRTVQTEIDVLPAAPRISSWTLEVEDWRPGASPTETEKVRHELMLDSLVPWTEIPELVDVSGLGRYRATIQVPDDWDADVGAMLHLGEVFDTVSVRVNGDRLPPIDPLDPLVDLGRRLHAGENSLEIEVATTLNNRLRVSHAEVYSVNQRQPYGLTGPIELRPYREKEL